MGVHEFAVLVDVTVATDHDLGVGVIVVAVIVGVFVGVDPHVMVMLVEVVGSQRQADAERGDAHRDHLDSFDRVRQHDPRQHRADEWGRGEDHLSACRAKLLCATHPQRDRGPVSERADDQRADDGPAVDRRRLR